VRYVDFRHRLSLRVRWAEVDLQGVVFNAHTALDTRRIGDLTPGLV
jgi:hypothetical protein